MINQTPSACNARMRIALELAQDSLVEDRDPSAAVQHLRRALQHARGAKQVRAWSKIMLAIRELSRVVPQEEPPGEDNWPSSDAEMIARNW